MKIKLTLIAIIMACSLVGHAQHIQDIPELSTLTMVDEGTLQSFLSKRGWEYTGKNYSNEWKSNVISWANNRNYMDGTAKEWFYRGQNEMNNVFVVYQSADPDFHKNAILYLSKNWQRGQTSFDSDKVGTIYTTASATETLRLVIIESVAKDNQATNYKYWLFDWKNK